LDFTLQTLPSDASKNPNFLTTDYADLHGYSAGLRFASQAGAVFSNPFSSQLARDFENLSLTRFASGPAEGSPRLGRCKNREIEDREEL
jgi:hypothetical protein